MSVRRKSISKRLRFEVFKRDDFTCQYCGSVPPKVILHVDHIRPVVEGGTNDIDNLATSCSDCNLGKSDVSLTSVPQSLKEKSEDVQEREAQLRGFYDVMEARKARIEQDVWKVFDIIDENLRQDGVRKDWFNSVKQFIEKLGLYEVIEAMEIAVSKHVAHDRHGVRRPAFLYFCGICWNKVKGPRE